MDGGDDLDKKRTEKYSFRGTNGHNKNGVVQHVGNIRGVWNRGRVTIPTRRI